MLLRILLLLICLPALCAGQGEANIWHFGSFAGLDFNSGAPVPLTNGMMAVAEGCASVSDANGNLLFYTNGINVWDRTHVVMGNGSGLSGGTSSAAASSTQAALIVKQPGNNNIYHIFTTDQDAGSKGFRHSSVDMSLNGNLGDVTNPKNNHLYSIPRTTERVTAIKHCNNIDYWIISHQWENSLFYTYPLTATGIGPPVISNIGSIHNGGLGNTHGYMKTSIDGTKLALCIQGRDRFEIFDFNPSTGVISNAMLSPANYNDAYGLEFSPDGTKLYVSCNSVGTGSPIEIHQFDLNAGTAAAIFASDVVVGTLSATFLGALQIGPDKKIYSCSSSMPWLGVIDNPDIAGPGCNFMDNAISLSGRNSQSGLPNFPADLFRGRIDQKTNDTIICVGESLTLNVSSGTGLDYYIWHPSSGQSSSTGSSVVVNPTSTTTYSIQAYNAKSNCLWDEAVVTVTVVPGVTINTNTNETVCMGEQLTLTASGGLSYEWSNGSTGATITVSPTQNSIYTVTASINSCSATAQINVTVINNITANAGNNDTICLGQTIQLNASGGLTYQWNNGLSGSTVFVSPLQSTVYTVTASINGCSDSDSVSIEVQQATLTASGNTSIAIGQSVTLSANGMGSYSWFPSEGLSCNNCENPVASPTITTVYYVTITDANGCTAIDSVVILVEYGNCTDFFIPNAFSPNNDGENDEFIIYGEHCIKSITLIIYNRWGERVYEALSVPVRWNGTYKNKKADTGVFYYYVDAELLTGEKINKRGNIYLLR